MLEVKGSLADTALPILVLVPILVPVLVLVLVPALVLVLHSMSIGLLYSERCQYVLYKHCTVTEEASAGWNVSPRSLE